MHVLLQFMVALRLILALLVGGCIGYSFGYVQNRAASRYEKMQAAGKLKNPIGIVPGSMARVAILLMGLLLTQLVCPVFFADGTQWYVSGGLVIGCGYQLFQHLQAKRKAGYYK
jgi:hypothetical protein